MPNMIWTLCLHCQQEKAKEKLISVTFFNVSNAILESSALDNKLRVQLAGINDLIASGGKYHKKCLSAFKYSTSKTKQDVENTALALIFLSNELHYAADKKQVL